MSEPKNEPNEREIEDETEQPKRGTWGEWAGTGRTWDGPPRETWDGTPLPDEDEESEGKDA